ncbi:MAG TPA: DUF805 domain-containing protein [Caulobacteraceae bacterium]|jgi:uncharacterized membrane protein YhaH (DUF805 family)|nr:DUF805 domain-containing protein [Caulobacteraceae bacterium]
MDIVHLLFSFEGRIRRLHYWLAAISVGVVVGVVGSVLAPMSGMAQGTPNPIFMGLLAIIYIVDLYIGLALGAKRCHDRDKSAWFLAIGLIPIIGAIWLFIELGFLDGTQGPNRFGPSPKGIGGPVIAPAV